MKSDLEVQPIVDPALETVLLACMQSTRVTAETLFPDIFYTEFSEAHNVIFNLIDSGAKKIAIAAPRGLGKTSIARTLAARFILFRLVNFICYVMNSASIAEMQTENLKRDLLTTPEVRHFFGNIKTDVAEDIGLETFSKTAWTAYGDVLVFPRGSGQQVRGLNWRNHRPELIIVDDLENKDEIRSEENRTKLKQWFYSDLMKSIDRYSGKYVIIYIDTLKHEDSLLQELLDDPEWASVSLALARVEGNVDTGIVVRSNIPTYMTDEEVTAEFIAHQRRGDLDTFYSEYMNQPVALADTSFRREHFRYFRPADPAFQATLSSVEHILIVDPAKTVKMQSADSAIVPIGIDLSASRYYIYPPTSEKFYPDQLYEEIFRLVKLYRIHVVGIEVTSLHEFIVQPLKNEMIKRGVGFELIELKAQGKKEDRIKTIVPYYRHGYVYHAEGGCLKLEQQLLSFPKSKLWDLMDCVGYLPKMLEMGERYFSPTFDEDDDPELEFAELEASYDPPLEHWRIC